MTMVARFGLIALSFLLTTTERPVAVVQAPDSPVRIDKLKVLNTDDAPPVLIYAATNLTDTDLEQFTVTVYVFGREGQLRARQVAPGRRTLEARATKYSAMVLDVGTIDATDFFMAGVDQAQRVGSDQWWRTDLRTLAEAAAKKPKP